MIEIIYGLAGVWVSFAIFTILIRIREKDKAPWVIKLSKLRPKHPDEI